MRKLISKLRPHPKNSELYGDAEIGQVDDLVESIQEVGLLHPPVISREGFIISGHRRIQALKQLKRKYVECEVIDVSQQNELLYLINGNFQRQKTPLQLLNEIKVLEDLWGKKRGRRPNSDDSTDNDGGQYKSTRDRIAKTLRISELTITKLKFIHKIEPELLDELGPNGSLTISSAYTQCKLRDNQKRILKQKKKQVEEDRDEIIGSEEQFYLYPKSCLRMKEDLEPKSVDVFLFSPPYWNMNRKFTGLPNEIGTEKTIDEYIKNILKITTVCHKYLSQTGSMFINIGDTFRDRGRTLIPERLSIALNDSKPKWYVIQTLIWDRQHTAVPESNIRRFTSSYEEFIWLVKDPKNYFFDPDQIREPYKSKKKVVKGVSYRWNKTHSSGLKHPEGKIKRDVLRFNRAQVSSIKNQDTDLTHTAIFPVELIDTILSGVVRPGNLVVDPMCGSCSTGVSTLGFGCYFVGYDLNRSFLEIGEQRMNQRLDELMS